MLYMFGKEHIDNLDIGHQNSSAFRNKTMDVFFVILVFGVTNLM